jgi:hypothetical protein
MEDAVNAFIGCGWLFIYGVIAVFLLMFALSCAV